MKIKVGIIGSGRMGERHADAYSHLSDVELVGFADVIDERSELLAKKFMKKTFSVKEMLEDESINAIDVCTPNPLHAQNAIASLKAGKHVLVEKPMATNLDDCDKMIQQAEKSKLILMVGHTYRFYPSSLKTKEIIDSGEIGPIKLVLEYGIDPGQIPGKGKTPDWALKKEMGGGVFFDAIHAVDKIRFWLNSEVSSVFVPIMDKIDDSSSAEQMGLATLMFSCGAVATLMPVAPSWGIRDTGCKMIGKKGALYVTYGEEVKVGKKEWKHYAFDHQTKNATYAHNLQGFINEFSEFFDSIKNKRKPSVTGEEGKKNLRVVLAMYESFEKRKIIDL
ncbi:Gfo/Idh/MocA family protein [Candidatus Nitrosotalea okcheonensis]|uniref:Putative Oxidoreductase, NAD-binding domain protein n=1 Tax=Candidatus Nitrosotalea okcheonensis TaxID=1903276 RepID=A0A2H1FHZ7_9ARCH|nr:Gfo/Idh/MocA family oxidoreductase [Candidatus Nitrosotalea okcheonensis]SMH72312.1 putative Oxidoreductase, NAD-binding domain protein [Candidatus Nitrosotalea okcheonensis]